MYLEKLPEYSCDIEKEYEIEEKSFDRGAYGEIFKGTRLSDNLKVAIKKLSIRQFQKGNGSKLDYLQNQQNLLRELSFLANLDHPFCLNLVNFSFSPQPMIATPYMSNGNLLDLIKNDDPSLSTQKNCSIYALISTMNFLHKANIIHRDLKPQNVFINDNKDICVADFGLSRKVDGNVHLTIHNVGSPLYMAPELILEEDYTKSIDVYSFGVIYYLSISYSEKPQLNDNLGDYNNRNVLMRRIANGARFVQPPNMSGEQHQLYIGCTLENMDERPTFEELAERFEKDESLWLNDVDKDVFLEYVVKCKKINQEMMVAHPDLFPKIEEKMSFNLSRSARRAKKSPTKSPTKILTNSPTKHFSFENPD